ncbi:MAG TPA: SLC13 family permease [Candidatus Avalokitesvara rifleensis]|uniref:SLC13 family permease n=1 Tax=Candidatus Avalokitesvara rifleensis TaxID=3367620 RepID=UPI0040293549
MEKYIVLIIFIASYIGFIFIPSHHALCACVGALLLVLLGAMGPWDALAAINWNVMGIFVGTLVLAELFILSKVPAYLAELLVNRSGNVCVAMLFVCGLTSFLSIFAANVATVLIVAPVALAIADRLGVCPSLFIISLAMCSNLQGTATLIGDPPSMILAGDTGMTFNDFFFYQGKPSIFFAVELGALASLGVLYLLFRGYKQPVEVMEVEKVRSWVPTWMLVLLIVSLAVASFFNSESKYLAGAICMVFGVVGLLWYETSFGGNMREFITVLDWSTTFFLMGVFVLVGSLNTVGWIHDIAVIMEDVSGDNLFRAFFLIVFLSVILSAFIDNIPYILAMLPVAQQLGQDIHGSQTLLVFGLLIGSCLGGNITPIGASANIVGLGFLKRRNIHVSFMEFVKIGLPFTIAAVVPSAIFLWIVWK